MALGPELLKNWNFHGGLTSWVQDVGFWARWQSDGHVLFEPPVEHLINGGFDEDLSGWQEDAPTVAWDGYEAPNGRMRLYHDHATQPAARQVIPLPNGVRVVRLAGRVGGDDADRQTSQLQKLLFDVLSPGGAFYLKDYQVAPILTPVHFDRAVQVAQDGGVTLKVKGPGQPLIASYFDEARLYHESRLISQGASQPFAGTYRLTVVVNAVAGTGGRVILNDVSAEVLNAPLDAAGTHSFDVQVSSSGVVVHVGRDASDGQLNVKSVSLKKVQ